MVQKVLATIITSDTQRHKTDKPGADTQTYVKQELQNKELIALARRANAKLIASNDVHFVEEDHADARTPHHAGTGKGPWMIRLRMRYTKQEWLKTPEQMAEIFADIPECLENTLEIANKVEFSNLNLLNDACIPNSG